MYLERIGGGILRGLVLAALIIGVTWIYNWLKKDALKYRKRKEERERESFRKKGDDGET